MDEPVKNGQEDRRAAVVARALDRERRRAIAAHDAAILVRAGDDLDMDRLAEHVARSPLNVE